MKSQSAQSVAKVQSKEICEKPPRNWRELMSRSQKSYRNRWNTEKRPYTPTPKSKKD